MEKTGQTATKVGIIDADLFNKTKHRFPNLVCMKLSAYHKELGDSVSLLMDYKDIPQYDIVYIAKVFTDTEVPEGVLGLPNVTYGGTGFFYDKAPKLPYEIEHHFPDYDLYNDWVQEQLASGVSKVALKFYTDYSIGFLTRGCFRHCPFCVNKNYNRVEAHSPLKEFLDPKRKKICMLDDNFLGFSGWEGLLTELRETKKPFLFKQGLDERLLDDKRCSLLFSSRYDGDFTFAFDNLADKQIIEKKIALVRKYTNRIIKFYCFTGFDYQNKWDEDFWRQDIFDLFERIRILKDNHCLPYVMRFARYNESPYRRMYVNIARWCNQPSMFKTKSFREFCLLVPAHRSPYQTLIKFEKEHEDIKPYVDMRWE